MTTIDVLVEYAHGLSETVKAELVDADVWELREHTGLGPLSPGDRIKVDEMSRLSELVSLEPTFVYVVHCHPSPGIARVEEEWRRDTWVTRTTGFTLTISTPSQQWFLEKVAGHPYVEDTELIRTPSIQIDLGEMLAHPHFGEMEL